MDNNIQQQWAKVIAKVWSDPKFKEKLLKNPNQVLKEEGINISQGQSIVIHENDTQKFHFVIPKKPEGQFSEENLMKMAGGATAQTSCGATGWAGGAK